MLLLALVVSIAAVDSLNPGTVGPALLIALGPHARRDVAAFTAGVFAVSTAGGLILVFGPGRALLALVSHPRPHTVHLVEAVAGGVIVSFAGALWVARRSLARRLAGSQLKAGRSAFLLGAGIMSGELPTAVPYFGALAAVTAGDHRAATVVALVLVYNALFVAPMAILLGILVAAGDRGTQIAARLRGQLTRVAPLVFPPALALLGLVLLVIGAAGLAR